MMTDDRRALKSGGHDRTRGRTLENAYLKWVYGAKSARATRAT